MELRIDRQNYFLYICMVFFLLGAVMLGKIPWFPSEIQNVFECVTWKANISCYWPFRISKFFLKIENLNLMSTTSPPTTITTTSITTTIVYNHYHAVYHTTTHKFWNLIPSSWFILTIIKLFKSFIILIPYIDVSQLNYTKPIFLNHSSSWFIPTVNK